MSELSHNSNRQPAIRFKGLTDPWKQRKLENLVTLFPGLTYSPKNVITNPGTLVLRSSNIQNNQIVEADNVYVISEIVNSSNVQIGDIIVVVRNGSRKLIGKHALVNYRMNNTVIGAFMTGIRSDSPDFFSALLDTKQFQIEIQKNLGATINQITNGSLKKMKFIVPVKNSERSKMGSFFRSLNNLIALHQRKVKVLQNLKKALLQRMFASKDNPIPDIRFAGFTDPWEQRKLGDVALSLEYGLNTSATGYDGENKYIRITDIDDSSHEFIQSDLTSPNTDLSMAENYLLKKGDILFARTGASVGKTYHYKVKDGHIYYAGFLIRARIKPEFDSEFVFQNTLTTKYANFIRVTSQRSGQPGVNAQEYARFELSIPSLPESKEIGQFFKIFDDTVALHQRKVEVLQDLKKALLQKMFI